jgi:glyoxylase-like metal-dependent hydrolase (beta-lactamase superfamily II)
MDIFTGGLFETNCYYLKAARVLVDAPEGAARWLAARSYTVETLLLTHGHVDHVWDAAQIQKEHGCEVVYHPDTTPMVTDPEFFQRAGFPWRVEPLEPGTLVEETQSAVW